MCRDPQPKTSPCLWRAVVALVVVVEIATAGTVAGSTDSAGQSPSAAHRWRAAAAHAVMDRATWVPAAGALVITAGDWDDDLSEWAVENRPIYGSRDAAIRWSDDLRAASHLLMLSTALAVRPPEGHWPLRLERAGWEQLGVLANNGLTRLGKDLAERERPDGSDNESFPSAHSSQAFAYAAASSENLKLLPLGPAWRTALSAGSRAMAGATAWARVEAGVHFPTDVLAGAALGNFVSVLFHDALVERSSPTSVLVEPEPGGIAVVASWRR